MRDLPWFTIATLLVTLAQAAAGMAGAVDPELSAVLVSASVVLGGLGKAFYNIGDGLKRPEVVEWSDAEED